MNTANFLAAHPTYFEGSYEGFCGFGGPCVYFHQECLRARQEGWFSTRHVEMLYATLTAWGMHRMGEGKTKLNGWLAFRDSLVATESLLRPFQRLTMAELTEQEYANALQSLWPAYSMLKLGVSDATVVINSKALFHILPHLIPPIDRQYTIRFFQQPPERWRDKKGAFRAVSLPPTKEAQFQLFRDTCIRIKRIADKVTRSLWQEELHSCGVTLPKAIDNAIVNYVKIVSKAQRI